MKLKVNKIALSIATAALMVTSILSTVSSAATTNEITLKHDKSAAKPGDNININVGYIPDNIGVAGFTINLYYDADKVDVYVPSDAEMKSKYDVGSDFSVITNYKASEGVVRIVGANLMSTNITNSTDISLVTFTVKSGATGDIKFWTDVESMVKSTDSGYQNTPYSAPTAKSPIIVKSQNDTTTSTTTTTTKATTTSNATETSKVTSTSKAPETTAQTTSESKVSSSSAVTTEKTTTSQKPATSTEKTTTTTKAPETTANTTTSAPAATTAPETTTTAIITEADGDSIFNYIQGENDYNSEEPVNFYFDIKDYITDYDTNYDVKVNISTTGSVNGGIGMISNGIWQSQGFKTHGATQDTWTYENINPNTLSSKIAVQLYFLKADSEFNITSIEVSPVAIIDDNFEDDKNSSNVGEQNPSDNEDNNQDNANDSDDSKTENDDSSVADTDTTSKTDSENDSKDDTNSGIDSKDDSKNDTSSNTDDSSSVNTSDSKNDSSEVENAVLHAQQQADKNSSSSSADKNPSTGSSQANVIRNIIMVASLAEIAWSIFVVIYNNANRKKENN